ncbi:MAG: Pyrimidine 5'-nucleotidase [Burkholderia sp.]|jgi:putative hydrolase of the HAD superfamily
MPALWLIDLDDTLFNASAGMLRTIHLRMNRFMREHLGLTDEEASALRTAYWARYGATFLGLWRHEGVDPREFLFETHNFDLRPFVTAKGNPVEAIRALRGIKVLFTNGPRIYADGVLRALGAVHAFDAAVTANDMRLLGEWRPKPDALMMLKICKRFAVSPHDAALVDDSPMNLRCAHRAGLKTVLCTGYRRRGGTRAPRRPYLFIDRQVTHIRELSRLREF